MNTRATGPVPVRTARGAGRAAGRARGRLSSSRRCSSRPFALPEAGRLAVVRVREEELVGFFRALGDRVLEPRPPPPALPDRAEVVLVLREPVGEDVRVAMGST